MNFLESADPKLFGKHRKIVSDKGDSYATMDLNNAFTKHVTIGSPYGSFSILPKFPNQAFCFT
jgi:hypothetical protein